jgi:hypothetical protein
LEGIGDGLVISEDDKVARFQHMSEMLYGHVDGQYLAVIGAVLLLGQVKVLGEEGKGLPGICDVLLQYGTHGGCGGVCDECKWREWVGVLGEWCVTNSKALRSSGVQVMG